MIRESSISNIFSKLIIILLSKSNNRFTYIYTVFIVKHVVYTLNVKNNNLLKLQNTKTDQDMTRKDKIMIFLEAILSCLGHILS